MSLTPISPFPFSDSNLKIPSTNYHHTTSLGTPETSPNTEVKEAIIEIQVQGFYKLYIEPLKGLPPVTMDKNYVVSPKFTYKFKVPLFYLTNTSFFCGSYVFQELAKLPMSSGLAMYLQPHILQNAVALAQRNPTTEFKIVFDVKVVQIDLADNCECEGYRRRGLVYRN